MDHHQLLAGFVLVPAFAGLGLSTTLASVLSSLVLAAGAILLAMLLAPKPPTPDDGKDTIHQTTPPRQYAYGTCRLAGSIMLKIAPRGDTLYQVQALVSHRINQFVQFYLHDDQVDVLTGYTPNLTDFGGPVDSTATDGRYGWDNGNPRIWIDMRFGADDETLPYWFTSDVKVAPYYGPTAIGKGVAHLGMRCSDSSAEKQQKRYPYGPPEPSAVCDTAFVYDPRDVVQDITDPLSWVFSRNPVLAIIHYLCFSEFGFGRDYATAITPLEDEWKAAADICDEAVATGAGGTQARYELGGFGTTENEQKSILALMLAACDGWLAQRGDGAYVIRVGKWQPSGVEISNEDIAGFEYSRGRADEETINHLDIEFTSPSHHYTTVQCDPFDDDADQTARGKLRTQTYDLTWVQDWRRARRIAKREFKRLREPIQGTLYLKLSGLNAAYERFLYLGDVEIPGLSNRYIENRAARFNLAAGGMRIDFIGADASIEDWDPLTDEGPPPPVIDSNDTSPLDPPANVDAFIEDYIVAGSTPPVHAKRIVVDFDQPIPPKEFDYAIQWRVVDTDPLTLGDQPGTWSQQRHNETPAIPATDRYRLKTTGGVDDGTPLEVSIASISSGGSYSGFSIPVPVSGT